MSRELLEDIVRLPALQLDDPEERYLVSGVSWYQYEELLEQLEDGSWYRVTYLEGLLEIMAPSRRHEVSKDNIGRLLSVFFEETRTRFWGLGSTTFRKGEKRGGTEPDVCYCIGTEKEIPDLAIEVVLTSGGVDKLAVYQRLGVQEVWFWQNHCFEVHDLQGERYEPIPTSRLLPNLDLNLLAEYVEHPSPLDAILEFREKLRGQMQKF
ncbi:Uma2 family endonuclease [Egbenema bharatensis]|uniref:Uma2 family endonuclease n=1 Tax=Egbenema bharatensis TaxID=3463334 RepID=UPI003A8BD508